MTFSSSNASIPVTCVLLFHEGKVLAAQRSAKMNLPLCWEFPGGKVEKGESPEACIFREIHEELGIEIEVLDRMGDFDPIFSGERLIQLIPFLASWKAGEINLLEHQQVKWLTKSELFEIAWAPADLPIVTNLKQNWERYQEKSLNYPNKN